MLRLLLLVKVTSYIYTGCLPDNSLKQDQQNLAEKTATKHFGFTFKEVTSLRLWHLRSHCSNTVRQIQTRALSHTLIPVYLVFPL